jgi:hypothetical protein
MAEITIVKEMTPAKGRYAAYIEGVDGGADVSLRGHFLRHPECAGVTQAL